MASLSLSIAFGNYPDDGDRNARHVCMVTPTPHDMDGFRCWCKPRLSALCGQCDGDGCWQCENGWRDVSADEAERDDAPVVVVHNE